MGHADTLRSMRLFGWAGGSMRRIRTGTLFCTGRTAQHTHAHACTRTHALARMHTHTHTHTYAFMHALMHARPRAYAPTRMRTCGHSGHTDTPSRCGKRVRIPKPDGKPMSARRSFDVARCSRAFGVPAWYTDSVCAAVSKGVSAWRSSRCDTTAISMRRITKATRLFTIAFNTRESFGMGWGPLQPNPSSD